MSGDGLESLVDAVQERIEPRDDGTPGSDARTALVVSCSMSDCEPGGSLWPVEADWNAIGVRTLGNQTRERHEGEPVLDGTIEHLRTQYEIAAVLVVGHTECEVIEDAYEQCVASASDPPAGIDTRLDPLRSLVRDGLEEGILSESMPPRTVRCRLVEYNVRRQVRAIRRALPSSVTTAGYVHDQDGAYRSFPDKRYLVALDGETEPQTIRARLPEDTSVRVATLLA